MPLLRLSLLPPVPLCLLPPLPLLLLCLLPLLPLLPLRLQQPGPALQVQLLHQDLPLPPHS